MGQRFKHDSSKQIISRKQKAMPESGIAFLVIIVIRDNRYRHGI